MASNPNADKADFPPHLDVESTSAEDESTPAKIAEKERRLSKTAAWKPALDRRTSYDKQDFKREMQMTGLDTEKKGAGFTEKKN
jgi:hypothetical protein